MYDENCVFFTTKKIIFPKHRTHTYKTTPFYIFSSPFFFFLFLVFMNYTRYHLWQQKKKKWKKENPNEKSLLRWFGKCINLSDFVSLQTICRTWEEIRILNRFSKVFVLSYLLSNHKPMSNLEYLVQGRTGTFGFQFSWFPQKVFLDF